MTYAKPIFTFILHYSLWNTGGTPEKYSNGTLTNFRLGVRSLWRGGLAKNLLEDFNYDQKGWANKVPQKYIVIFLITYLPVLIGYYKGFLQIPGL